MAQTWKLNYTILPPVGFSTQSYFNVFDSFVSNGKSFATITFALVNSDIVMRYDDTQVYTGAPSNYLMPVSGMEAYRTITFETEPPADLLTWLQANAVKQAAPVNQVVVNGETVLDLRADTVTPETLKKGYKAHDKSGAAIVGIMEAGVDTSDATATAKDMVKGKTAYVKGQKVTGSVTEIKSGYKKNMPLFSADVSLDYLWAVASVGINYLFRPDSKIEVKIPSSQLGDTAVSEVLAGKTFTSSAGLKKSGTMPNNGAVSAEVGAGEVYTIPKGYHDGTGTVTGKAAAASGAYDITATDNADGSQNLAIVDAGSGSAVEMCSLTLKASGPTVGAPDVWYFDGEKVVQAAAYNSAFQVVKNSLVVVNGAVNAQSGLTIVSITGSDVVRVCQITGDSVWTLGI